MVLLKDIAQEVGLSVGTVSQILHRDDPRYSETTKRRVREAAKRLGYYPNPLAQALATGRTRIVAVYVPMLFTPYYAIVLHHLGDQFEDAGYQMIVRSPTGTVAAAEGPGSAGQWPVDMTIFVNCGPNHPRIKVALTEGWTETHPFISIGPYPDRTADWIDVDLFTGTMDALRHLYGLGHRRIAYLVGTGYYDSDWEPRAVAYRQFVKESGLEPLYVLIKGPMTWPLARQTVREFIAQKGCPDALFCHFDEIAIAACRGLRDAGLRVPNDVAVVGCDGLEILEYLECPLTTIVQPVEEMCRQARLFMEKRIGDPQAPQQTMTLKAELCVRESSGRRTPA